MASQYVTYVVTPVVDGRGVPAGPPVDMIEVQFTPRMRQTFQKHQNCKICLRTLPENEMIQINGGWYCTSRKHYLDDPSMPSGVDAV